jgi:hypothetical protein
MRRSQDTVSAGDSTRSFGHAIRFEALIPLSAWHFVARMRGFCNLGQQGEGGEKRGVITLFGHRKLRDTNPQMPFCRVLYYAKSQKVCWAAQRVGQEQES